MEKEQELTKLVNVLRQTARVAMQPDWEEDNESSAEFCIAQYNRIYERMKEIDPSVASVFAPLSEGSSLKIAAIACRQLAAYYEDEVESSSNWQETCDAAFDPKVFRKFWRKGAFDMQELGEAIRESVQTWAEHRQSQRHGHKHKNKQSRREKNKDHQD
ncbi:MAG: hypothetical protein HQM13_20015 [SAR324 cluster bacterium]|nr:hypothetical protein [SAR324 cluster bacterium]